VESWYFTRFVKRITREEGRSRYAASVKVNRISRAALTLPVTVVTVVVPVVVIVVIPLAVTV
jgi:hypothetical protein